MKFAALGKSASKVIVVVLVPVLIAVLLGLPPEGPEQVTATTLELRHRPTGQLDYPIHTDLWSGPITVLRVRSADSPCAADGSQRWSTWAASSSTPLMLTHLGFLNHCEQLPMKLRYLDRTWELTVLQPTEPCLEQLTVGFPNEHPEVSCDAGLPGRHLAEARFGGLTETLVAFEATKPLYPFEQRVLKNAASMTLVLKDALRYHQSAYQTCMANAGSIVRIDGNDWRFLELETRSESRMIWLKMVSRNDERIPAFDVCTTSDCSVARSACTFNLQAFFSLLLGKVLGSR